MLLFLGHRIADRPLLGLICKRLLAGVMEDGRRVAAIKGTPQGGAATDCQKSYACDVAGNSGRLKRRRHESVQVLGQWLSQVVMGTEIITRCRGVCVLAVFINRFAAYGGKP